MVLILTIDVSYDVNGEETAEAYFSKGLDYYKKGMYDEAIVEFTNAIEINPIHDEAYNKRGFAYYKKGDFDRSIADYHKALESARPDSVEVYYNMGLALAAKGEYSKARKFVSKAQNLGYQVDPGFFNALRKAAGEEE
jgi:tetratricopeptide (TPR) repeat protein